jgi:hypothetical protein
MQLSNAELERYTEHIKAVGLVLSQDGVAATEKFGRETTMLQQNLDGLKVKLGMEIIPTVNHYIEANNRASESVTAQNKTIWDIIPVIAQVRAAQRLNTAETEMAAEKTKEATDALEKSSTARWAAQQRMIEEKEGLNKLGSTYVNSKGIVSDLTMAYYAQIKAIDDVNDANGHQQEKLGILQIEMGKMTTAVLYNQAAQGLDAEASRNLAEKMGLIDPATTAYMKSLALLKEDLAAKITQDQYNASVAALSGILNGVPASVDATISALAKLGAYIQNNPITDFSGIGKGFSGTSDPGMNKQGTGTSGTKHPPPEHQYAIGGWGGGRAMVGEAGPEMVNLPAGSYVTNNYDMRSSYNLTAHYPTYQNASAAKTDLIGLTMLHNAGAAKWAQ